MGCRGGGGTVGFELGVSAHSGLLVEDGKEGGGSDRRYEAREGVKKWASIELLVDHALNGASITTSIALQAVD